MEKSKVSGSRASHNVYYATKKEHNIYITTQVYIKKTILSSSLMIYL